jgi:hypothetical protein
MFLSRSDGLQSLAFSQRRMALWWPVRIADAKRSRVYISCGQGFVDVHDATNRAFARVGRVPTVAGARTSLFVPELDRLFVAVRATAHEPAAVWIYRPRP